MTRVRVKQPRSLDDFWRTVAPVLGEHGLSVRQEIELKDDRLALTTEIAHDDSEQWVRSSVDVPLGAETGEYLRMLSMHSLTGILALPPIDDAE